METTAKNWSHFVSLLDEFSKNPRDNKRHLFRGHADISWKLSTSFSRALPPDADVVAATKIELAALNQFRAVAHLYLPASVMAAPMDTIGWWTLMQHYRAPTRLIDWTASPYVAAYFAVNELALNEKDGVLICLDLKSYDAQLDKTPGVSRMLPIPENELSDPNVSSLVYSIERRRITDRMAAQQGVFMISKHPLADHGKEINAICTKCGDAKVLSRIIIPAKDKIFYLGKLRRMNITGLSLFPGADGIGKSIAEMIELSKFGTTGI